MNLKIISLLIAAAKGDTAKFFLESFIETDITFDSTSVTVAELKEHGVITNLVKEGQSDLIFKLLPNYNRGIFVRICDINAEELQKVQI